LLPSPHDRVELGIAALGFDAVPQSTSSLAAAGARPNQRRVRLGLRQRGNRIEDFVNDTLVGGFVMDAEPSRGRVVIGFHAKPNDASQKVRFRRFTVKDFQARGFEPPTP
jgi:hypothetical protein